MSFFRKLFGKDPPSAAAGLTSTASNSEQQYWSDLVQMQADLRRNDVKAAMDSCDAALEKRPDDPVALQSKINLLLSTGKLDDALGLLDRHFGDGNAEPYRLTALSWHALLTHQPEKAIEYANTALSLEPRNLGALNNRGFGLYCLGRFEGAIREFEKVLGLDARFELSRRNLVLAHIMAANKDKALYEADRLIERGEDRAGGHMLRARVHNAWREKLLALAQVRLALRIDPRHSDALLEQVRLCGELGCWRERDAALAQLREAKPAVRIQSIADALVADSEGDHATAGALCGTLLEQNPNDSYVGALQARLLAKRGALEDALDSLSRSRMHADCKWARLEFHSRLLQELGRQEEAEAQLTEQLERNPDNVTFLKMCALSACCAGKSQQAQELLHRAISAGCPRSDLFMLAFVIEFNAERFHEALAALGWSTSPNSARLSLYKAAAFVRTQDWGAARTELDRALMTGSSSTLLEQPLSMLDQWQWLAGCHAYRSLLPGADKSAELAKSLEYFKLSIKAGDWELRQAWYQPRLWPLRELADFRQLCRQ